VTIASLSCITHGLQELLAILSSALFPVEERQLGSKQKLEELIHYHQHLCPYLASSQTYINVVDGEKPLWRHDTHVSGIPTLDCIFLNMLLNFAKLFVLANESFVTTLEASR
jgi:hypothetical protein